MDTILDAIRNLFPSTTYSFRKAKAQEATPSAQTQPVIQEALQQIAPQPSSTPHPLAAGIPQPDPTMSPYTVGKNITPEEVERKLVAGFKEYSKGKGVPMEQHIPQLVEGAKKYPGLQNNPFLTAAVSLNETSGGRNWTENNNPLSWGARIKGIYKPASNEQAIEDMMSAV
jgi:hypothetical protein